MSATCRAGIIVVGTRASLQSAIARKRNAGTVVDSIVADDIASFEFAEVARAGSQRRGLADAVDLDAVEIGFDATDRLGGTVLIETRKPLELKKGVATVNLSGQHLETTKEST
jgi:iron complex outermembrane receptor protein